MTAVVPLTQHGPSLKVTAVMPLISPGFEHFLALGRIPQQILKRNAHFSPALKRQAYEQVGQAHCCLRFKNGVSCPIIAVAEGMTESGGCVSEGTTESYDRAPHIHISVRLLWFECQSECQSTWMTAAVKKDTQSGVSLSSSECGSLMCKGGDASESKRSLASH